MPSVLCTMSLHYTTRSHAGSYFCSNIWGLIVIYGPNQASHGIFCSLHFLWGNFIKILQFYERNSYRFTQNETILCNFLQFAFLARKWEKYKFLAGLVRNVKYFKAILIFSNHGDKLKMSHWTISIAFFGNNFLPNWPICLLIWQFFCFFLKWIFCKSWIEILARNFLHHFSQ